MGYWPRAEGMNQIKTSLTPHRPGTARSWSQMITSLMLLGRIHGPPLGGWLNIHINHPDVVKYNPIVFCVFFWDGYYRFWTWKTCMPFSSYSFPHSCQFFTPMLVLRVCCHFVSEISHHLEPQKLHSRAQHLTAFEGCSCGFIRNIITESWNILKHVHEEHINYWRASTKYQNLERFEATYPPDFPRL